MKNLNSLIMTLLLLVQMTLPVSADTLLIPSPVAEAALLMDADTGQILYEKNSHSTLPPASITKLMTALMTVQNLSEEATVTFSKEAVMSIERGSSHIGMKEGETISVNDALHGLLLMSANEVANGLAETISGSQENFAFEMTEKAQALGCLNTNFTNAHGLYDVNHYTSAYDMALITQALLEHSWFLDVMSHYTYEIGETNLTDEVRYLSQSHKILNPNRGTTYFREDAIAGKSGYTSKSGYTLVTVASKENRTLIAVTLNTDAQNLYTDTHRLLDYGFDGFEDLTLPANILNKELTILDGNKLIGTATISMAAPVELLVPKGITSQELEMDYRLPEHLMSPADTGDAIADIAIHLNGQLLAESKAIITKTALIESSEDPMLLEMNPIEPENPKERAQGNGWIWAVAITFLIAFAALFLYYRSMNPKVTYKKYKAMRDAEKDLS